MSDRELLELAAKAIGKTILEGNDWAGGAVTWLVSDDEESIDWAPFSSDGDALRLATRLNIDIMFFNGFQEVGCCGQGIDDAVTHEPSSFQTKPKQSGSATARRLASASTCMALRSGCIAR